MRYLRICALLALGAAFACAVCEETNLGEILTAHCAAQMVDLAK